MSGFFKKLFKDGTEGTTKKDEDDVIISVTSELMVGGSIGRTENSFDTNRLPGTVLNNSDTETFKGFSSYLLYSESNPGMVRKNNQDSIFTGEFKYNFSNSPVSTCIAIVADGMGGLSKGEVASSAAAESVSTYMFARLSEYIQGCITNGLPHCQVVLGHISDAMKNANRIVWDKGVAACESIGTTFTGVFIMGNTAYFGHAGDSRAYIIDIEKRSIEKVTRDHSLVGRLVEMGHVTEKEARTHPRRNEIYRMLGLRDQVEVDTYYRIINENSVILLMSDGLWEFVDDNEILNNVISKGDLQKSVKSLVGLANDRGGHDNISLVIVKPIE